MLLAEIDYLDSSRLTLKSEWRHKELIKTIPGAHYERARSIWRMPLSWSACLALRSTFGRELEIGADLYAWAIETRTRMDWSMAMRDRLEPLDWNGDEDLFPYQRAGVEWLATMRRAILADDPGVGKTAQSVRAIKKIYQDGTKSTPCLVVCPNTAKLSWKREIERWWPGVTVQVVSGSSVQRRKQLAEKAHFYIINWEALRSHSRLAPYGSLALKCCLACGGEDEKITTSRCQVHDRELNLMTFESVIADEAHRCKDASSQQARALKAAAGNASIRFAMTGTPIANNVLDLWSLLNFISPKEWPSKVRWSNRFCDIMYNAFGGIVVAGIKAEAEDEFRSSVSSRMRRMPKELVLPFLPPVVSERRDVPMTPKQQRAYNEMAERLLADMDSGLLVATSPLIRTMRLLQLASSYGEVDLIPDPDPEVDKPREHLRLTAPSSKIDAFIDDLDDYDGRSVIVFAASRQLIELLSDALERKKITHGLITGAQSEYERQEHMDQFQAGRTKMILCTIGAARESITLTAADTVVFLQRSWSRVDMTQSMARAHRVGSEIHESILRIDYVAPGSLEEAVFAALDDKGRAFEDLVKDRNLLARAIRGELS